MYKDTVSVPKIDSAILAEMNRTLPGLSFLTKIPLVTNEKEAIAVATMKMNDRLPSQNCVTGVAAVSATATGWDITLTILD